MSETSANNKRIAKNTIFLYFRMLLVMLVSLYTTRVLLSVLGVEDFGIFNVVGGIVTMFVFLTGTMSSASQRFFSYELGQNNSFKLQQIFNITILLYCCIAIIVVIIAETIGLWFLNTKMNIPQERENAAFWVYQFSIVSFLVTIITTPYHAAIIAQEKMQVYAIVSIVDAFLKLGIIYLLSLSDFDKLIFYSILIFCVTICVQSLYVLYCKKHFSTYKIQYSWDKTIFFEMLGFAGWNMIGSIANVLRSQGINILLNVFFNPVVNAARGIAYQVNSAMTNFVNNFYTAIRPQIFKSYSSGQLTTMHDLVLKSSRFAYYLMLFLSIPLYTEMELWLSLWLKEVPEYAILFTRLIVINALLEVYSFPLVNAMQATGKIKNYQIVVSVIYLFNLPVSYVFLKCGCPPETPMYVNIVLVVISFIPRLILCKKIAQLPIKKYLIEVFLKTFSCTLLSILFIYFVHKMNIDIAIRIFIECSIGFLIIVLIGLNSYERKNIIQILKNLLR